VVLDGEGRKEEEKEDLSESRNSLKANQPSCFSLKA